VAHSALSQAAALLDEVQESYGEPIRRQESWTAGHVHAAASAMRYGRDLLNTHFGFSPEGDRASRSEWAPVIASAPVTRAVMLEVGLWARQTAQIGASAALSARAQVREEYARRNVNAASQWLWAASAAVRHARHLVSEPAADVTLLHAIPPAHPGRPRRHPARFGHQRSAAGLRRGRRPGPPGVAARCPFLGHRHHQQPWRPLGGRHRSRQPGRCGPAGSPTPTPPGP
jgi:hypothetical protein